MGSVWVADHLGLKTQVVVKFIAPELATNPEAAARFEREAAASAQVKSPHVVQIFDHGTSAEFGPYIVMELLEGQDLGTYLKTNGRLPAQEVAAMIGQVAKALSKAHAAGIIHRDIKPDNIFLSDVEGGEVFVKLLDFGIAKAENRIGGTQTTTGQVVGTPYYMSPEQLLGEAIDSRTDLWSLGVVAFEALTGKRPFKGETIGALTLSIHKAAPSALAIVPDAPPAFDAWFARACAKDRDERFANARDAAQALYDACKGFGAEPKRLFSARPPMMSIDLGSTPSLSATNDAHDRPNTQLSSSAGIASSDRRARKPTWLYAVLGVVVVGLVSAIALGTGKSSSPERATATVRALDPTPPASVSAPPPASEAPIAAPSAEPAASASTASTDVAAKAPAAPSSPRTTTPRPRSSGTTPKPNRPRDGFDDIK